MKRTLPNIVLAIILLHLSLCTGVVKHRFQVSVRMGSTPSRPEGTHICNGAIVSPTYILTAATCTHNAVPPPVNYIQVNKNELSVLIESSASPRPNWILRKIIRIDVPSNFNKTSLENDLALLQLNASIPMGPNSNRPDLGPITIDDDDIYNYTCLANFYNRQETHDRIFALPQTIPILNDQYCSHTNKFTKEKKYDICTYYDLPGGQCNITEKDHAQSIDRGTPLICSDQLVGVLSSTFELASPPQNCNVPRKVNTFYTRVSRQSNWIYSHIGHPNKPMYSQPIPGYVPGTIPGSVPMQSGVPNQPPQPGAPQYPPPPGVPQQPPQTIHVESYTTKPKRGSAMSVMTSSSLIAYNIIFLSVIYLSRPFH